MIGGDTNTGVPPLDGPSASFHNWEVDWIAQLQERGWADAFRVRYPRTAAPTWYSPNRQTGYRLDQIFVHRDLHGAMRSVRHRWGATVPKPSPDTARRESLSDHAAMLIDLEL